jgi:hypothetical protein
MVEHVNTVERRSGEETSRASPVASVWRFLVDSFSVALPILFLFFLFLFLFSHFAPSSFSCSRHVRNWDNVTERGKGKSKSKSKSNGDRLIPDMEGDDSPGTAASG